MKHRRLPDALGIAALFVAAVVVLGWLLLGLDDPGGHRVALPDGASAVETLAADRAVRTVEEAAALPADAWRPATGEGFIERGSDHAAWVRVTLRNSGPRPEAGVLSDALPYADRVDFFVREDGAWRHRESGEAVPAARKPLWGRLAAFPVTVPAGGDQTVYLRMEDFFAVWLELTWWPDQAAFHAWQARRLLGEGCYFGVLLALLFYNAAVWVRVRFADTGRYLGYLLAFAAFMFLSRNGGQELGLSLASPWMEAVPLALLALSGALLAEFARVFLELRERRPRGDALARRLRGIMALVAVGALVAPLVGFPEGLRLVFLANFATHVILLGLAFAAWRAGARQARYFVLAFGTLFVGVVPMVGFWLDVVSFETAMRAMLIGSALEMLVLSVATAGQVRPQLRALVLSSLAGPLALTRVRESGVEGYLEKDAPPAELETALRAIAAGRSFFSPRFRAALAEAQAGPLAVGKILSRREQEVLGHVLAGGTSRDIGERIGLSPRTVEFHRANVMSKLGASNLVELLAAARQSGLA